MDNQSSRHEPTPAEDINALFAAFELRVEEYKNRIDALEDKVNETFWQRMSGKATAVGLVLGLIFTGISIYNATVTDPEKARVDRIAQFNEAVNAAAKIGEDLQLFPYQNANPGAGYTMITYSLTQISIEIATAETLLRDIHPADVGVQQLLVLMDSALNVNDFTQAKKFLNIAQKKYNVTPYETAEIDRYDGKYDFSTGDIRDGRQSYLTALHLPIGSANVALFLGELTYYEIGLNDCADSATDIQSFVDIISEPGFSPLVRSQMLFKEREVLHGATGSCRLDLYTAILPTQ